MPIASLRRSRLAFAFLALALPATLKDAQAQEVDDGTDAALGPADTKMVLALIRKNIENSTDAKVSALRRTKGSIVCGSVNAKNRDGLYLGERGFIADLSRANFSRVPEGPELLNPKAPGFEEKERVRELYFKMCLA